MKSKYFYSVQFYTCDWESATLRCYETKQSAENFIKKAYKEGKWKEGELYIVEQRFAQDYRGIDE